MSGEVFRSFAIVSSFSLVSVDRACTGGTSRQCCHDPGLMRSDHDLLSVT
jgi:hypothetical protein